jgi:hypothetical protein
MSGRQPTVYLHIGIAKTGTTYLQGLLWHNRGVLSRHGLRYPGDLPGDHFRASVDLRQKPFAGEESTYEPGAWDKIARAAVSAPDRAVISHETLTRTHLDQVRRAVESLRSASEVHLVITVRDLGRQLPAVWQEQVKNRGMLPYERFLDDVTEHPTSNQYRHFWEAQDILDVLGRWSVAAPPDRVHVVTVPQPGSTSGLLWERFASVIGVDPAVVDTDVPVSNVSLGVAEAELLRRMNPQLRERLDWPAYERRVKVGLAARLAAREGSARLTVPPERRARVQERAEALIEGLRTGGYDIVGDLEELRPVFDDRPVVMPGDIPVEDLLAIAAECVGDLVAERPLGRGARRPAPPAAAGRAPRVEQLLRRWWHRLQGRRRVRRSA